MNETKQVPYLYDCPFLEKELWISATGKISPCCAPDKERDSLGDFGNYPKKSLSEVLESKIYRNLVDNYKQNSLCKTCVMRKPSIKTIANFRDISKNNPRLKSGIIFRSALLFHYIEKKEMLKLLSEYNIKKIIDLRSLREVHGNNYDKKTQDIYTIKNIPFDPWQQSPEFKKNQNYGTLNEIAYRFFVTECKSEIKQTLETILESSKPVLFHCHAGKDRTGIVATIAHLLSGVELDTIYLDYLTSKHTEKAELDIALNIITNEGGIYKYLENCGLTKKQIKKLKDKILK